MWTNDGGRLDACQESGVRARGAAHRITTLRVTSSALKARALEGLNLLERAIKRRDVDRGQNLRTPA